MIISIHAPPRGATLGIRPKILFSKISIHAPPRGATQPTNALASSVSISIHAPPRGATLRVSSHDAICSFQFTPLREGRRLFPSSPRSREDYFNSRPSARGDSLTRFFSKLPIYFNSRPSARGDGVLQITTPNSIISIHAPPRGATANPLLPPMRLQIISIHAPPRGAT